MDLDNEFVGMEIEDFKYTIDLSQLVGMYGDIFKNSMLYGYIYLHQFTIGEEIGYVDDDVLIREFERCLEDGESITVKDGVYTLKIREVTDELVNHVKFILSCYLVPYDDFIEDKENNIISFKRIEEESYDC